MQCYIHCLLFLNQLALNKNIINENVEILSDPETMLYRTIINGMHKHEKMKKRKQKRIIGAHFPTTINHLTSNDMQIKCNLELSTVYSQITI